MIVIEGLDGAGTTTQAKRLVEHLNAHGQQRARDARAERRSGRPLIREMLTGGHAIAGQKLSQSTFGLLFAADRLDHLQREVEPQLAAGATRRLRPLVPLARSPTRAPAPIATGSRCSTRARAGPT